MSFMKNDTIKKLRGIIIAALSVLFLLSAVLTVLYLCGIMQNEDIPYLCFALSMLVNSANIILNLYANRSGMENAVPEKLAAKPFGVFFLVTAVIWLISYVLFVFLK